MNLSKKDRRFFIINIRELLKNEQLFEMNQYIQHGSTTTFTHCLIVAYYSYMIALLLPLKFDTRSLIRGAMLHDFYLYDWHIPHKSHRLHGFKHPNFALCNACRHYKLNFIEKDIIKKHMWPLTINNIPLYRESLLVCLIDKICSLAETLHLPIVPKELKEL